MGVRRRLVPGAALVTVVAAVAGGVMAVRDEPEDPQARPGLRAFSSCDDLAAYMRPRARVEGPLGATGWFGGPHPPDGRALLWRPPGRSELTGRGIWDEGADRASRARVTGRHVAAVRAGAVERYAREVDVVDMERGVLRGTLRLAEGDTIHEVLPLTEQRLLVFGSSHGPEAKAEDVVIGLFDISDPARPVLLKRETVTGTYVAAGRPDAGGIIRVVLEGRPDLRVLRTTSGDGAPVPGAEARNTAIISEAGGEAYLPVRQVHDAAGGREVLTGPAIACTDTLGPTRGTGVGVVTVLELRPDDGDAILERGGGFGVIGNDSLVRITADRLYVGTGSHVLGLTDLHGFAAAGIGAARKLATSGREGYLGSGTTRRRIATSGSLSPYAGMLRVLADGDPTGATVTVYAESAGRLEPVAEVGGFRGMGDLNEGDGAMLWAGPTAAVTSSVSDEADRPRVSPYLLDLADPAHPRVVGVPRIAGYKGTLHAVGDGRVLAGTTAKGTRPAEVRLVDPAGTPGPGLAVRGVTGVGYSAPCYTWLPDRNLAYVPAWRRGETVLLAVRVGADGRLRELGRFASPDGLAAVVPAGDRTVVVTPTAVVLLDAETLRVIRTVPTGPGPDKGSQADCW